MFKVNNKDTRTTLLGRLPHIQVHQNLKISILPCINTHYQMQDKVYVSLFILVNKLILKPQKFKEKVQYKEISDNYSIFSFHFFNFYFAFRLTSYTVVTNTTKPHSFFSKRYTLCSLVLVL